MWKSRLRYFLKQWILNIFTLMGQVWNSCYTRTSIDQSKMLLGLSFAWQIKLVSWRQMGFLWAIKYFPFMFCLDHDLYGKSILICSYFTETIIFISELPVIIRKCISCINQYYFYIAINLHWFFWQKLTSIQLFSSD